VKTNWKRIKAWLPIAFLLPCAGCGGISATRGVSPATFLIPGGLFLKADPLATNQIILPATEEQLVAESSKMGPAQ